MAVDLSRRGPALGTAQDDHRPTWPKGLPGLACLFLDFADLQDAVLQGGGHRLVHAFVVSALYKIRGISVTDEQRLQLVVADPRQDRRVVDLVTVEVKDRQHRPVGDRVEELIAVPTGGERTGL